MRVVSRTNSPDRVDKAARTPENKRALTKSHPVNPERELLQGRVAVPAANPAEVEGSNLGDAGAEMTPDQSAPSPRAAETPADARDTVAPKNIPQSELVINKLEDLLRKNQITPQLEKDMGMNRDQIEQFVEKYRKAPKRDPRAGGEIQAKPGENKTLAPNPDLPGIDRGSSFNTRNMRDRGAVARDQVRDNIQDSRVAPPRDLLPRFEGYMNTLSRSKMNKTARPAGASGSGGR